MTETLWLLPLEFWLIIFLLFVGAMISLASLHDGLGIPLAAVIATIVVWYIVDVFYNDYQRDYLRIFPASLLTSAWRQVAVFIGALIFFAITLHPLLNAGYRRNRSHTMHMIRGGLISEPIFQNNLDILQKAAISLWIALILGALLRYQEDLFFFFFPYLGKHPGPWVRSGLSGGSDTLLALANYLHMMTASIFGVVAALSKNPRTRRIALFCAFLSWPHYLFDRTRGFILIMAMPGVLAWALLRIRGSVLKKSVVVLTFFLLVNAWFGFIISARGEGTTVTNAFLERDFSFQESSAEHHQGLNMFEELNWIIRLRESGRFVPKAGHNYFANLVNPIPRFFWPSKPTIGIDYSLARGLGREGTATGVAATLSQGLIGQGVVNFGLYTGPIFAAFLMGLWICFLARLDLTGREIGHIPLFGLGLITTFTLGRDITFINLYPITFGFLICLWLNRRRKLRRHQQLSLNPVSPGY